MLPNECYLKISHWIPIFRFFFFSLPRWQTMEAMLGNRELGIQQAKMQLMLSQTGPLLSHHWSSRFPSWLGYSGALGHFARPHLCHPHPPMERETLQGKGFMLCTKGLHRMLLSLCDNIRVPCVSGTTPDVREAQAMGVLCSVAVHLDGS